MKKIEFLIETIMTILLIIIIILVLLGIVLTIEVVNFILQHDIPNNLRILVFIYMGGIFVVCSLLLARKVAQIMKYY